MWPCEHEQVTRISTSRVPGEDERARGVCEEIIKPHGGPVDLVVLVKQGLVRGLVEGQAEDAGVRAGGHDEGGVVVGRQREGRG